MDQPPGLEHPDDARFAWRRYRRILWMMNGAAIVAGGAVVGLLYLRDPDLPWLFALLTFAGVFLTIALAAALMGLMFLSNGTGHDAHVTQLMDEANPIDD